MSRSSYIGEMYESVETSTINQVDYSPVLFNFVTPNEQPEGLVEASVSISHAEFYKIEAAVVTPQQTDFKTMNVTSKKFAFENKTLVVNYSESDFQGQKYSAEASAEAVKELQINQERALWTGIDSMSMPLNPGFLTNPNVSRPAQITPTDSASLFTAINQAYADVKDATRSNSPQIALGMTNGLYFALNVQSGYSGTTFLQMLREIYGGIYVFENFVYGASDFFVISNPSQNIAYFGSTARALGSTYIQHERRTVWQFARTSIGLDCRVQGAAIVQNVDISGVLSTFVAKTKK